MTLHLSAIMQKSLNLPDLKNMENLKDIKVNIVLTATDKSKSGFFGQALGGYIISNKDF